MPRRAYVEALKRLARNILFILSIRPAYRFELVLTAFAVATFVLSYVILGFLIPHYISLPVTAAILLSPALFQIINYYRKLKIVGRENASRIPPPSVPLITVIVSAVVAAMAPILTPVAIFNALFIEDISGFLSVLDVDRLKRDVRLIIEPLSRRELAVLQIITIVSALASYAITRNLMVIIYPVISYMMLLYSIIYIPPEYRAPTKEASLLEEIGRRIPFLYFLYMWFYNRAPVMRYGKEAGYIGNSYTLFVRRMAGAFTLAIYSSLAASPLLFIVLGNIALISPVPVGVLMFFLPMMVFIQKRSARSSKINRNLLLILSYFASMASVAEDFTNAMQNLKQAPELAKLFGLEKEVEIYLNIYSIRGSTELALEDYAGTIPNDFYRDTIRTIRDLLEHEGYGAVFRSLVNRLRDYTIRHIDRIATSFQNVASNVISVIILLETAVPIILFLSDPMMMPIMMMMAGVFSGFMIAAIASMALPDLPSEYVNAKPRYRRGAVLFTVTASALAVAEYILVPDLLAVLIPLNAVPSFFVAFYYVSKYDMTLNNDFLNKFPDLLVLFSSSMTIHNSVSKALLDLSAQETFTPRMRRAFQRLANIFEYVSIERLSYKGPYWYKYFMFMVSISSRYGMTPRELYKAISDFMLEFKKFFATVQNFGRSVLFLTLLAIVVMNIEYTIAIGFMEVMAKSGMREAITQIGTQAPFPILAPDEIEQLRFLSYISMLVVAISNGIAIAKAYSGTIRDGKWILIFFLLQILLIYIGRTTSFGIQLGVPQS